MCVPSSHPASPPASVLGGWGYLEELGVVGAVLAGVGLRVLPAPLQLAEAAGRVQVAGVQLGQIDLGEVGVEVLLARHLILRTGKERNGVRPELRAAKAAASPCGVLPAQPQPCRPHGSGSKDTARAGCGGHLVTPRLCTAWHRSL